MNPVAAYNAWMTQKLGPFTVRYGKDLVDAGADLPAPDVVRVPTRAGTVRCLVQRTAGSERPAVVVHLHGGAFVMRYPQMDDFYARHLAATAGVAVVSVDYDVAPQRRYPVAQHQAHDVAAWLARHGDEIGVDGSRLVLSGFSAGGNLAASAALQARDTATFAADLMVLVVPSLDVAEPVEAKRATVGDPMIGSRVLRLVRATYFRDAARREEPYASPLLAPDLAGLPPAVVLTGERDALRREGDAFAARLTEAGVPVLHRVVAGRDHYVMLGDDLEHARSLLDLIAARVRDAVRSQA